MNNKYEYDEDDDFWYNKDKDSEELIDDFIDDPVETEVSNDDFIPQVPTSETLDFTQSLPDFFAVEENVNPYIEENINEVDLNNQNDMGNTSVNSNPQVPNFASSSFFGVETPQIVEEVEEPVVEEPVVEEVIDEKRVPKELLTEMPDLGPEDEEEENFDSEFKITFIILVVLIGTVLVSPYIYALFN